MARRAHSALLIRTPEGIEFSLPLAGPFARFLALLIDVGVVACAASILHLLLSPVTAASSDLGAALFVVSTFLVSTGYGIGMEWFWNGRTLGKRVLGLRVMDEQGLRMHFGQVMIRNLLRVVDMFPLFYLAGGLACFLSRRRQRLGDIAAGTIVVRTSVAVIPSMEKLADHKYNSLRDHPQAAARLRRKITGGEASLAVRALLQRERLEPSARIRLFAELAGHFRSLEKFPVEACEGITDERYVLNVLDIVYSSPKPPSRAEGTDRGTGRRKGTGSPEIWRT